MAGGGMIGRVGCGGRGAAAPGIGAAGPEASGGRAGNGRRTADGGVGAGLRSGSAGKG